MTRRHRYAPQPTTNPWTTIGWISLGVMICLGLIAFVTFVLFGVGMAALLG